MTDIASLGIRVQTQGVKEADQQLDSFAKTSERVEQSVKSAATTINKGFKPDTAGIKAQREELAKLVGQIDPAVLALDRLDKQEQKLRAFRTKGLVDSGTFADLTAKINANREALSRFTSHATSAGLSAKQLAQATRQLPMQFTDIFTSLAAGQRPMQVLLQQGGQLKDIFGGIGPAFRAFGGYVAGLINPLTLVAAGVAALGFAWKAAIDEAQAFNLALIETGQFSGNTADDLEELAQRLDDTTAATARFAGEVVRQVESTGRFSKEQVETISAAVTNMAKATQAAGGDADEAIQRLVRSFVDLSRDPVEALLRLNETQHFLTQSTLDQVRTLVEQGDKAKAVEIAINAMADTTNTRSGQMRESLSATSIAFSQLRDKAAEALDTIVNKFRDADEAALRFLRSGTFAARTWRNLIPVDFDKATSEGGSGGNAGAAFSGQFSIPGVNSAPSKFSAIGGGIVDSDKARRDIKEVADAQREWDSSIRQGETSAQRLKRELDEAESAGKRLGKTGAEIASAQEAIRAAFASRAPKGRKPPKENTRGIENASDRFDDMVGSLRTELSGPMERVEQQHIKRMRELEQAARDGKRSHEDLTAALKLEGEAYKQAANDVQFRIDAEVAGLSGPIAQAQQAHEATLRRIEELKQQGLVTGSQYIDMLNQEAKAYQADMEAAQRAADPIGALLSDMREELDLIGTSNSVRAVMIELRRQNIDAMSAEGQAAIQTAKSFEEEAKAKQRSIELMDEFRSGAADALTDIATGAKSAKDALLDFFDSLIERLIRLTAEKWIEKAFGSFGTNEGGAAGSGWAQLAASIFGGGRASGGPVAANRLYEVGERNKPELLQMHGRSYLIPGNQGNVVPIRGDAANESRRGDVIVQQKIEVRGTLDRRAGLALEQAAARKFSHATRRNG